MAFTYFFRDRETLELIKDHVIPTTSGKRNIKIWDAGCAMGPEPYSVAIYFAENIGRFAFKNVHIDATDIDGSNLFKKIIEDGIYSNDEIKRLPADILKKYFSPTKEEGKFIIDYNLRQRMKFQKHDLRSLNSVGNDYSLIVCKNVLLHLTHQERIDVIKMFHKSMASDGFFVTEQTQKIPKEIEHLFKRVTNNGQLFTKA